MNEVQRTLRQLIRDDMYVVDPHAVAAAIVARAHAGSTVARVGFHSNVQAPPVRSFCRDPAARSVHPARSAALQRPRY